MQPGKPVQAKKPRVRAVRKQATRSRVLAAAKTLFTQKGYFETRAGDIAEAAGVAHGTVFAHFGSKAGLILQLLEEFTLDRERQLVALSEQARDEGATPAEEFWEALRHNWRSDLENLGLIRAYASYSWVWEKDLEAAHGRLRNINRRHVASVLERAGLDLPAGGPSISDRVAMFYAMYREALRVYSPEREDALWTHLEQTARFLFPLPDDTNQEPQGGAEDER